MVETTLTQERLNLFYFDSRRNAQHEVEKS
jgi:hypothetical protein